MSFLVIFMRWREVLVVVLDGQVVEIDLLFALRGHGVYPRGPVSVGYCMGHLESPGVGFGRAFFPSLCSDHSGTVGQQVDAGLKPVPDLGLDGEGSGVSEAVVVGEDLQLLTIANKSKNIPLIDESDIRFDSTISVGHDVRLHRVIAHVLVSHEVDRPLKKYTVQSVSGQVVVT